MWSLPSDPVLLALLGGLFTTLLNAVGSLPVLFLERPSRKVLDVGLGFAAGVMIAASFTSLLLPAVELHGLLPALTGFLLGAVLVNLADKAVPHMHQVIGVEGVRSQRLRAATLFALAVVLHNMPEGLAVGVGFGSGNLKEALALTVAIGLQNLPEGLSVGFATLSADTGSKWKAYVIAVLSGAVEAPLALVGAYAVFLAQDLLPCAMGFAAGAMIFVVSDEMIPETHRVGHERLASYGVIAGVLVMVALEKAIG